MWSHEVVRAEMLSEHVPEVLNHLGPDGWRYACHRPSVGGRAQEAEFLRRPTINSAEEALVEQIGSFVAVLPAGHHRLQAASRSEISTVILCSKDERMNGLVLLPTQLQAR